MNTVAVPQYRLSKAPRALRAALASLGMTMAGLALAQTPYRDAYPLVDANSLNNLCVNVNLNDPTDAQLQQIQDAGFKFVRHELTWEGIERTKGTYDWASTDRLMARAKARGIRVMALLAYSNPVYSATGAPNTPESRAAFAAFAAAATARYQHQGVIWEIYNEPNLAGWWPNPNPVDYTALVKATADAIRNVSADEWIVGLTTDMLSSTNRAFVEGSFQAGLLTKLDGIGFHPYTQSAPETMAAQWEAARALVNAYKPTDHPVSLLAGEVGYPRAWPGITQDVQASYSVRIALFNLAQGIGFTNLYSYDDAVSSGDWQSTAGLTSNGANVPYPAYFAVQNTTAALAGYRFSKRLDLGRADDYCLLFVKANDPSACKIVCWTTGESHTMRVPSSAVSFTPTPLAAATNTSYSQGRMALAKGKAMAQTLPVVVASGGGLSVPAASAPVLYDSNSPNPLLILAANWAKLPVSVTLSTKADAVAQLGALIASPAWTGMPAGASLTIEDKATFVQGYARPSFTTTLTNLANLTIDSPEVQTVFNSLGALQDETNAPRSLRITVNLPDGGTVVQTASVARKQPMIVFPTTPQSGSLTLRVENPTGAPYSGSLKASSGASFETQSLRMAAGESFKMMFFTTLSSAPITGDVRYSLYDGGPNVLVPSSPAVDSTAQTVYRSPQFIASSGYKVAMGGPANVPGSATLNYGTADWSFLTGGATADIAYSFGLGSKYVQMTAPTAFANTTFAKTPLSIGMWLKGDNSGNTVRALLLDASNQTFQVTGPRIDWTGWKWVSVPVQGNFTAYWGGSNDGQVHGAMRVLTPFLLDSSQKITSGTLSIFGISVIGQK